MKLVPRDILQLTCLDNRSISDVVNHFLTLKNNACVSIRRGFDHRITNEKRLTSNVSPSSLPVPSHRVSTSFVVCRRDIAELVICLNIPFQLGGRKRYLAREFISQLNVDDNLFVECEDYTNLAFHDEKNKKRNLCNDN